MSCSCNCSPCECDECDSNNEPLASALDNFTTSFFGTLTKSCVDGKVVWTLPCDLEEGFPGFPRNEGEGIACYLLRIFGAVTLLHYFPGSNAVFLDEDYVKMSANGQPAFPTFQQAYDAANALQVSTGKPVVIAVGNISAATGGDVVLTAAWNPDVSLFGLGNGVSFLGTISSSYPTASFAVDLAAHAVSITSIVTSVTDAAATTSAGAITIAASGNVIIGSIISSNFGTGNGGAISLTGPGSNWGTVTSSSVGGTGGAITIGDFTTLNIATSNGGVTAGAIRVGVYTQAQALFAKGIGAAGSGGLMNVGAWSNIIAAPAPSCDCSGAVNGGNFTAEKYVTFLGVTTAGASGNGGTIDTFDYVDVRGDLNSSGGLLSGKIEVRRFNEINVGIIANGGTGTASILIRENTSIESSIISAAATGNASTMELKFNCRCSGITHTAVAGNVGTLSIRQNCVIGNIVNTGSGTLGDVLVEEGAVVGNLSASSSGGTGPAVTLQSASTVGSITMGTSPGVLKCNSTRISGQIDTIVGTAVLHACVLSTPTGGGPCINEITANTPRITNCLFIPDAASDSINASAPRTVLSYNNLFKNAVNVNVTLSGANNNVDAALRAP